MYGALLGDIIGSPYEFDMGDKTKDFPLFCERSEFTDDSVMTIAVAEAFYGVPEELKVECRKRIEPEKQEVLYRFERLVAGQRSFAVRNRMRTAES